ncbi:rodlin [Uniformispora flossi]|uniref:rodlin n=1 Tax=Uniformispora flossi TaxID=3390723 RepID=UPI003C30502F
MSQTLKKVAASASVVAAAVGVVAAAAPAAMAGGNNGQHTNFIGNSAKQNIGNTSTNGLGSPNFGVVNGGALNCFDVQKVSAQVPVGAVVGLGVGVQDLLNDSQNQTCTNNSVQQNGDDVLSHVLSDILANNG